MKTFQDKLAVVSGGASGIGLGLAEALGERGARVALLDIEGPALDGAVAALSAKGISAEAFQVDVADRAAMDNVARDLTTALGPVHILCNNAGVGTADPLQIARDEDWDWVLSVNLMGVINGLQAFLPAMTAHGEDGHILNTASVAGLHAMKHIGVYNTSKFAVVGLTESLRDDLSETALGASVLCPGFVNTNINQSRRNRQERFGDSRPPQISADAMRAIDRALKTRGLQPIEVGRMAVHGIETGRFYIVTDPTFWPPIRRRFEEMASDIAALHAGLPASE